MASTSTPSAYEPVKDLILVHTVQLKPMIKAHFSGRMVSSGITDVAFASVYCTTGNVNEQVMLTNLTSGMGSLLFLPRQHLYPVLLNKQHHHEWTTSSIPTVYSVSPQRDESILAIVPQVLFINFER